MVYKIYTNTEVDWPCTAYLKACLDPPMSVGVPTNRHIELEANFITN